VGFFGWKQKKPNQTVRPKKGLSNKSIKFWHHQTVPVPLLLFFSNLFLRSS
jgi:hypothetical protein